MFAVHVILDLHYYVFIILEKQDENVKILFWNPRCISPEEMQLYSNVKILKLN